MSPYIECMVEFTNWSRVLRLDVPIWSRVNLHPLKQPVSIDNPCFRIFFKIMVYLLDGHINELIDGILMCAMLATQKIKK